VWEEELLGECRAVTHDVSLRVDRLDCWLGLPDLVHGFTVRGAYNLIITDNDGSY